METERAGRQTEPNTDTTGAAGDSPGRPSMIGLVGWAVLFAAVLAWEGIGLVKQGDAWPTFSDMLRKVTHPVAGRWVLFGLWLWLGWHLFVRGWRFFLRG